MSTLKNYIQSLAKKTESKRLLLLCMLTILCSTYASAAGAFEGLYSGTVSVVEAISGVISAVGAFTIFWKMIHGDSDVRKAIIMVVGGAVTIMALEIIIPRIF